eukprot:jgi/Mesen1/10769/ME000091S10317
MAGHMKHTHVFKLSGTFFKQAPLLISFMLFVWSLTVFRRSGNQPGVHKSLPECDQQQAGAGGARYKGGLLSYPEAGGHNPSDRSRMLFGGSQQRPAIMPPNYVNEMPSLTIFCAPKPYTGEPEDPQRRALLSWLRLSPPPQIVLLGEDPTFHALAAEFKGRVSVEPELDYNFYGVPLFHSMIAKAQSAETDLSMIINGDIILLNDLMPAVLKMSAYFDHWILTAARWDLSADFPFNFDPANKDLDSPNFDADIRKYARAKGSLHTYGGVDFWMWNNSPLPLHTGNMPPFAFGRGKYDNWLTHEAVEAGLRQVVDASDAVTSIHVAHSYAHVVESQEVSGKVADTKSFWSTRKKSSWELFANIHLAQSHGTYSNQKGTALHVPWRLASCFEPSAMNVCLVKRVRPANCSCEYSAYSQATQSDPQLEHKRWTCGSVSVDSRKDFSIDTKLRRNSAVGLPHTMEQLLPQLAKEVDGLQVVILVAVTNGYADMLMNFVCNLRKLGLADNLLIAALDEDLYRFAFTQGLAVYYENIADGLKSIDSQDCAYGTQCFRQFTKLKSRAVLRVLKAGFSVLWTDVDIVWYKDPLPDLMSFGPGTFPIQSNEPNETLPGTGIRRINSGFYFARADDATIEAFEAITDHAAHTKLSEQPSFYDVLCGEKGELLVKEPGKEECVWTNGLRTVFLDRARYPNGAVHKFWDQEDVTRACKRKGCAILHNNWISGKDNKMARMTKNGYWYYDTERRMCTHSWHVRLKHVLKAEEVTVPAKEGGASSKQ